MGNRARSAISLMQAYNKGLLITFAGVVVISPDTLLIRLIDAPTLTQMFWRGILSGLAVLLGYWALTGRDFRRDIRSMGWPGFAITLVFAIGTTCFMFSVTHTTVANTLFITSTSPVFAALISVLVLREVVSWQSWATIAVTLIGISVIAAGSLGQGPGSIGGDLAALGAALSLAVTFSIARAYKGASMVPAIGFAGLLSGLMAGGLAADLSVPADDMIWVALLGLAVVPLGAALLATGPRYLPAPDVSLILLLESIFGPLLVWLILAENPGTHTLIGGAIVLAAMGLRNSLALRRTRLG